MVGLTEEIVERSLERYKRNKFGWYGSQGGVYMDGNMNKAKWY